MPRQLRDRKRVGKECMTVPTCWTKEKSQNTVFCAGTDQDVYLNDCANTTVRFSTFGELENVDLPEGLLRQERNLEVNRSSSTVQVSEWTSNFDNQNCHTEFDGDTRETSIPDDPHTSPKP